MKHGPWRAAALVAAVLATASPSARADESTISNPGDHPRYTFEVEPQLLLGYAEPFHSNGDFGLGFRVTFRIADGFVKSIDDSVGVGAAFDFDTDGNFLLPVVLQWNFWLSTNWSVFAEPGIAFGAGDRNLVVPILYAGGRLHVTDHIAVTLRLGYPDVSLGASFFL